MEPAGLVCHPSPLLASVSSDTSTFGDLLPWIMLLLGMVVIGAIVIAWVRRLTQQDSGVDAPGFTLQQLRDMHAEGLLNDEEFARAKQEMIEQLSRKQPPPTPPSAKTPSEKNALDDQES
jgi:hypothetical protein